jgi:hypothetical protein
MPEGWHEVSSSQHFRFPCEPHHYLVIYVWCVWNYAFFVCKGKKSNTYAENIRFHHTKYSHLKPSLLENFLHSSL